MQIRPSLETRLSSRCTSPTSRRVPCLVSAAKVISVCMHSTSFGKINKHTRERCARTFAINMFRLFCHTHLVILVIGKFLISEYKKRSGAFNFRVALFRCTSFSADEESAFVR